MVNWQEYGSPFENFTEEITQEWKKYFSKEKTEEWLRSGLKSKDFDFAHYLDVNGEIPELCLNHGNIEKLRKEYNNSLMEESDKRQEMSENEEEESESNNESLDGGLFCCDQCEKDIINYKTAWFSDREKDLDFCSNDCYSKWFKEHNAQTWLESQEAYNTKEKREEVTELDCIDNYLEGELDLSDFVKLVRLNCSENSLTSLNVRSLDKLEEIDCSYNSLIKLDLNECNKLQKVNFSHNKLAEVNLPRHLVELNCEYNKLKKLDIEICTKLEKLDCSDNLLGDLDLGRNTDLKELDIRNNNFENKDLNFLRHLTKLKVLQIGNCDEEDERKKCNRFYGSLKELEELDELKEIDISNTDIDKGLEYLPKSVELLYIDEIFDSKFKVAEIVESEGLYPYEVEDEDGSSYYDYQAWRKNYDEKRAWKKSKDSYLEAIDKMTKSYENKKFVRTNFRSLADKVVENFNKHWNAYIESFDQESDEEEIESLRSSLEKNEFEKITLKFTELLKKYKPCIWEESVLLNEEKSENKKVKEGLPTDEEEYFDNLRYAFDKIFSQDFEQDSEIERSKHPILYSFEKFIDEEDELSKIDFSKLSGGDLNEFGEKFKQMLVKLLTDTSSRVFQKKIDEIKKNKEEKVRLAPNIPNILAVYHKEDEDYELSTWKQNGYNYVYPDIKPLIKEIESYKKDFKNKIKNPEQGSKIRKLPTRLLNINNKAGKLEIVETIKDDNPYPYAILSYVWGKKEPSEKLSEGGKKALAKAIKTCKLLKINYLWMDQLCINQDDPIDKSKEVPKMRDYYGNGLTTLIAIHKNVNDQNLNWVSERWDNDSLKVLKIIINSEWFSRSWTFQEGWLSKQTIFMFDDYLIDGSLLAQVWAFNQLADVEGKYSSRREFDDKSVKIATPIGWARYKDGYKLSDKIEMSLHEALKGVKEREQGVPVDGIYSVLGLLPYGDKVKPNYKPRVCPECPSKEESKECKHKEENKQWAIYTKEELEEALMEVMKEGLKKGYAEPLAWHGSGGNWIPYVNKRGSTEVRGGVNARCKPDKSSLFLKNSSEQEIGIKFEARKYSVIDVENITGVGGDTVLGGIYSGTVKLTRYEEKKQKKEDRIVEEIKVWGLGETLRELSNIKGNRLLVIPDENKIWGNVSFAMLVLEVNDNYQRIGLVELEEEDGEVLDRLNKKNEKIEITFIDSIKQTIKELNNLQIQEAKIEQFPKSNS